MNNFIDEITPKLNAFLAELQDNPKYSHIIVEVQFFEVKDVDGIKVSSNAGMWLRNSNMMDKEITDFLKKEYDTSEEKCPLAVTIKFKKMEIPMNQTQTKSSTTQGKAANDFEQASFYTEKPKYKFTDVVLPDETIKQINEAISTIDSFDMVYNHWNFKSKEPSAKTNICFFGAPGTGKTMCAHALADKLGKEILIASYADIQSQYVGVGPKNLKAVFQTAEDKNALLFFDEADSFLRKRTSDNSSSASMHYNSMTNEMMKHLEDFNGIVIFATNLTENTDEAFKTRLSFSIEFKVPDEACRAKIIERMIPSEVPLAKAFSEEDFIELSKACEGFVGRDIRNSIKTILSVGAQNHEYPFTKEQFLVGFKKYKENKDSFNKSTKNQKANPLDVHSANSCILNLLTYAAWIDGKENDVEIGYLKLFSGMLGRNKLVINSISDLPEFEEICHTISDIELKKKALKYLAYFMANTNQKDSLYIDLTRKLAKQFALDEDYISMLDDYHHQAKELSLLKEKIN